MIELSHIFANTKLERKYAVTLFLLIRHVVSMAVTQIHHALKCDLHTATGVWYLRLALSMKVAELRVAHDCDVTTDRLFE